MRTLLGRAVVITLVGVVSAVVSANAAGATSPSTPSTSTTTATTTPSSGTTTTTTTTTATTTTSAPPLVIPTPGVDAQPTRGPQSQIMPTIPPPPTTTTTTTTTLPPDALPAGSGDGRRAVYSKSRQRVWTVEADGTVTRTYRVSGRLKWNQPTPGTYSVFSRSSYTCNIKNPAICWRYMVRFAKGGDDGDNIGFHEIPKKNGVPVQSEAQLGQPLSGGCVRQATIDAEYMWFWAPVDTKVVVLA